MSCLNRWKQWQSSLAVLANFFSQEPSLISAKKAVLGHYHSLNYLLFGTEFSIAILKTKASHLQTNSYTETLKQPWLVSFSLINLQLIGYSAVRPLLKGNVEIWQLCGKH